MSLNRASLVNKPDLLSSDRTFLLPVLLPPALVDLSRASRSSSPRTRKMTMFVSISPLPYVADSSLVLQKSKKSSKKSKKAESDENEDSD